MISSETSAITRATQQVLHRKVLNKNRLRKGQN